MPAVLAILAQVIGLLPGAIKAGIDVSNLVAAAQAAATSASTDPTDAQWQAVDQGIKALQVQLNTDPPEPAAAPV